MTTLAEKLRAVKEKREAQSVAQKEYLDAFDGVPPDLRPEWMQDAYLRGHADALAEAKVEIDALRDQSQRFYARVKLLEKNALDEHSRLAQEEAKPAAVGVVGSVRWGVVDRQGMMASNCVYESREVAEVYTIFSKGFLRVVAIVDPAQIVPLASATPLTWAEKKALHATDAVYRGLAQNAQEGEG
jgi:hypothetical protein